jgi:predicted peptidase
VTRGNDAQPKGASSEGVPGRQVCCSHGGEGLALLRYLLFLPAQYDPAPHDSARDVEEATGWPLMVFLHGSGERGDDLKQVKKYGPPMIVEGTPDFPFVVVSPQCPAGRHWEPERLMALVDDIVASYRIDRRRIVLTGASLGAFGMWQTASAHPGRFAALVPVCGWGDPAWAARLRDVPVWMFHGEEDCVVPISGSLEMLDAVLAAGGDARLTSYPGVGHDAWTQAYATPELYAWLLERRTPLV